MEKTALLIALGIVTVAYIIMWGAFLWNKRKHGTIASPGEGDVKLLPQLGVGFGANFLDTLGVGSFAITSSIYKLLHAIPDDLIPGTMNVGHALPTIVEAFIFVAVIAVDFRTLIGMIVAAVLGAWFGAGIVSGWPKRRIQIGLGLALICRCAAHARITVEFVSCWRRCPGTHRDEILDRRRRKLHVRGIPTTGSGPVRSVHDSDLLAGYESARGVSDHDGLLRVPDAGGRIPIYSQRAV